MSSSDDLDGRPTFVWARSAVRSDAPSAAYAREAVIDAARAHLASLADVYAIDADDGAAVPVRRVHADRDGARTVSFGASADGVDVFRRELHVVMDRTNGLVAVSGSLPTSDELAAARGRTRELSVGSAVDRAVASVLGGARTTATGKRGAYDGYSLVASDGASGDARAKRVFADSDRGLVPAYYVEVDGGASGARAFVVDGETGSTLFENELTAAVEFSYRVFADTTPWYQPWDSAAGNFATPHPTGVPDGFVSAYQAPSLVTLESLYLQSVARNDPWLPDTAFVTTGNNVDAYADLVAGDGYDVGDLRPTVTAPGVFDRTMLFDIQPNANAEQIAASATNLFFVTNWLHDSFFDAGFDEASGNAQHDNFGRGGLGGDRLLAEAQDLAHPNDARVTVPADGSSPRLEIGLYDDLRGSLRVNSPAAIAGDHGWIRAPFGAASANLVGLELVIPNPSGTTDGCSALASASVASKVVLLDRTATPACSFATAATNAQAAGAAAVLFVGATNDGLVPVGTADGVTIPVAALQNAANFWKAAAAGGPTLVDLVFTPALRRDGSMDVGVVAHEWGHVLARRLVGDANGLTNGQGKAIDEGSADFVALMAMIRAEDINVPSNANWSGAYAVGTFAAGGRFANASYFGLRRFPYSVDDQKNTLRFRHVARGVTLPSTTAAAPGVDRSGALNDEPHHAGEVWGSMLFECYVSLLRAHPFQEAQDRMKHYFVQGLSTTPIDPTFVEARDALVAAAAANDPADAWRFQAAFARRGLGLTAIAPRRTVDDLVGGVESYLVGNTAEVTYRIDDSVVGCDGDGILDVGETGLVRATVRNVGFQTMPAGAVTFGSSSATAVPTFPDGAIVPLPGLRPGEGADVRIRVGLTSASGTPSLAGLSVVPDWAANVVYLTDDAIVHADVAPTNVDSFSRSETTWSLFPTAGSHAPELTSVGVGRRLVLPAPGRVADVSATTPPIAVGTGGFSVSFSAKSSFESATEGTYPDGMVLEASVDGGGWLDVERDLGVDAGYDQTLATGTANPLAGRRAYVKLSASYQAPAQVHVVDFGTAFAGRSVKLRFRVGTNASVGGYGVELDDVTVTGAVRPPFLGLVVDPSTGSNCDGAPIAHASTVDPVVGELVGAPASMIRRIVTLDGSASRDPEGRPLTYAWTQLAGPPIPLANANGSTASFVANVVEDTTFTFQLAVGDGSSTSYATVDVRVLDQTPKPVAAISGPSSIDERNGDVVLDGAASSTPLGTALTHTWVQTSGPAVMFTQGASITFTPPEVAQDTALTFTLTVDDGEKQSDVVSHTVTVLEVDRAPTVSAQALVNVASNAVATVTAIGADEDGTAIAYAWTQIAGPSVELLGNGTATVAFVAPGVNAETTIRLQVVATSGAGASAPFEVEFVVAAIVVPDAPPVLAAIGTTTVDEGATASVTASATDTDGDAIAYAWTQTSGPTVALTNASTATVSFVAPAVDALTVIELRATATANALSDIGRATIVVVPVPETVTPGDHAPLLAAIAATTLASGESGSVTASATDADGDVIAYAWTQISGPGLALDTGDGPIATFVAPEVDETAVVELLVTATANGATDTAVATIVVTPASSRGGGGCSAAGGSAPASPWFVALCLSLLARRRVASRRTALVRVRE